MAVAELAPFIQPYGDTAPDKKAKTLTIEDNGLGMNREALVEDLGTIARSGSTAFLEQLTGDARNDMAVIGQFGVGFYSAFMVADTVEVVSLRAGEDQGWRWGSDAASQEGRCRIPGAPAAAPGGHHLFGSHLAAHHAGRRRR